MAVNWLSHRTSPKFRVSRNKIDTCIEIVTEKIKIILLAPLNRNPPPTSSPQRPSSQCPFQRAPSPDNTPFPNPLRTPITVQTLHTNTPSPVNATTQCAEYSSTVTTICLRLTKRPHKDHHSIPSFGDRSPTFPYRTIAGAKLPISTRNHKPFPSPQSETSIYSKIPSKATISAPGPLASTRPPSRARTNANLFFLFGLGNVVDGIF